MYFVIAKNLKLLLMIVVGYRAPTFHGSNHIYFIEITFLKFDFATTFLQVLKSKSIPKFIRLSITGLSQYCEDG
jgi:hypothetical protein